MATRTISFAENEFYHIYNRGTDKRVIYQSPADYQRFLELLFLANSGNSFNIRDVRQNNPKRDIFSLDRGEPLLAVGAYCLMPNHFHLLVKPLKDGGVSKFMNKLTTGYSMYFNKRYERTGALFEGCFKAKHSDSDEYLKYLFSYIHLNPMKLYKSKWREEGVDTKEAFDYLNQYSHSSFLEYIGSERNVSSILERGQFPEYFSERQTMEAELFSWLTFGDDPEGNPRDFPRVPLGAL